MTSSSRRPPPPQATASGAGCSARSSGPASAPISGWSSKAGAPGRPTLRSQRPGPGRLAPPEAVAVVAGVPPLLVEPDLLGRRDAAGVGPVAVQVVDPGEQVRQPVAVPVHGDDLNDPARAEAKVGRDAERLARAEVGRPGLPRCGGGRDRRVEAKEVELARRAVRHRAKAAEPVEPFDDVPAS